MAACFVEVQDVQGAVWCWGGGGRRARAGSRTLRAGAAAAGGGTGSRGPRLFVDAHPMLQFASALVVVGVIAAVSQRLGMSMSVREVPMSSSEFWWKMAVFAVPLGVINQVLFEVGLILQFSVITVVAGIGIWVGERFFRRRGRP